MSIPNRFAQMRRALAGYVLGLVTALPVSASAADFYVSTAGTAQGNGTKASPWSLRRRMIAGFSHEAASSALAPS